MNLDLNSNLGNIYKNNSQKARVITEAWVLKEIYCPSCGENIYGYDNNRPVADYHCKKCVEDFELKSKQGRIGKKVSGGAYSQMIKRINSPQKPNFFFMGYLVEPWNVNDFFIVPKHFFISEIIEERRALSENAQRAGWIGSNILFSKIPKAGQIFYVENGNEIPKEKVLEKWQRTIFLKEIKNTKSKGWIFDIMNCIDSLDKKEFLLLDIYSFESDLSVIHPENKNIRPKIRQQLQFLRDKKYLKFLGDGLYKIM